MNRSDLREMTMRRCNDQVGNYWSASYVNSVLNDSLGFLQRKILRVDPFAFLSIFRANLTKDESYYPKPVGYWWAYEFSIKNTSSGKYERIQRRPYSIARDNTGTQVYAAEGTFFSIFPAPSADLANGLQCLFTPTLTMSNDSDIPALHLSLHRAIAIKANLTLLFEVAETPARAEVAKELNAEIEDIPTVYAPHRGQDYERIWIHPDTIGRD